jgi:restriction endonuclease S subunit
LRDFEICLPSLEQQYKFAQQVEALEKIKTTHYTAIEKLDDLFHALQQRAFKGEL